MKKRKINKKIIMILVSIIIIGSAYLIGNTQTFIEGNNTPKTAFEVPTFPYSMRFKFASIDEEKWFKFAVSETKTLKVNISRGRGVTYKLYSEKELSNIEPEPLTSITVMGQDDETGESDYYKVKSGTYYIKLNKYNDWSLANEMRLRVDLLEEDKYENNDTWKNATVIAPERYYDINLYGDNDVDWFKVKVDKPQTIKFNLSRGRGISYNLYKESDLESTTKNPLTSITVMGQDDETGESDYYKVESGTYYIKLNKYNDWSVENIMRIRVDLLEEDEYENNDTWHNATLLTPERYYNINLYGDNDVDWFKVKVDKPQTIKFNLSRGRGIRYNLYKESDLESTTKNPLTSITVMGQDDETGESDYYKVESGIYYIKLNKYNDWSVENIMRIRVDLLEEDEYENNDTWQNATVIAPERYYNINLYGDNDVDWFKVKVNKPQTIKFNLSRGRGISYNLYKESDLESTTQNPLRSITAMGQDDETGESDYYKVESGTYYIKLNKYNDWSVENIIRIKVDLLEEDKYENNDSWQNAKDFIIGEEKNIILNAPNDVDWFKLNLTNKQSLKIKLDAQNSNSYKYSVYKASELSQSSPKSVASGSISANGTERGFGLDLGTYYIKLENNSTINNYEQTIKVAIYNNGENYSRPTVSNIYNSSNFDVNSNIELKFSTPMDISSLNKENIVVKCYNDPIDFDIVYEEIDNKLVIIPKERLNYSSTYNVFISSNVKSRENNLSMAKDYNWSFTTRAKRPDDDKVGNIKGKVVLSNELQGLSKATQVKLYSGNSLIKTVAVNSYGDFIINDIPVGTYTIKSKLPGFLDDSKSITITAYNQVNVELSPVYGDANSDGIIDIYDLTNTAINYDKRNK